MVEAYTLAMSSIDLKDILITVLDKYGKSSAESSYTDRSALCAENRNRLDLVSGVMKEKGGPLVATFLHYFKIEVRESNKTKQYALV